MQEGAFALIDCLGFKGIWRRENPELLINKLKQIEQIVQQRLDTNLFEGFLNQARESGILFPRNNIDVKSMKLEIRLLSDTVAVSLQNSLSDSDANVNIQPFLVRVMCSIVSMILDLYIESEPSLVLRGCITYGEHICERNFIIGPAVDEAAEYMNIPDGAFVWLHPKAAGHYKQYLETIKKIVIKSGTTKIIKLTDEDRTSINDVKTWTEGVQIFQYDMPIKGGDKIQCFTINPLNAYGKAEARQNIIDIYSSIMSGDRIDIWLKRQHTLEFLAAANNFSNNYYEVYNPIIDSIRNFVKAPSKSAGKALIKSNKNPLPE